MGVCETAVSLRTGSARSRPIWPDVFFGTRYVGGIHGRLLTAWSVAGLIGPLLITSLRERAIADAIDDLVARVDPALFAQTFGAGVD